jgi:parallel beta-helix repeat protein
MGATTLGNHNGVRCQRCDDCLIVGNVISRNFDGVLVNGGVGNTIQGNLIGTDPTGMAAVGNARGIFRNVAVDPFRQSEDNLIGGTAPETANLISGNGTGVVVGTSASIPNRIEGNLIGTDVTGLAPLHNLTGVFTEGTGVVIGGTDAGAGNVLSGSHGGEPSATATACTSPPSPAASSCRGTSSAPTPRAPSRSRTTWESASTRRRAPSRTRSSAS